MVIITQTIYWLYVFLLEEELVSKKILKKTNYIFLLEEDLVSKIIL